MLDTENSYRELCNTAEYTTNETFSVGVFVNSDGWFGNGKVENWHEGYKGQNTEDKRYILTPAITSDYKAQRKKNQ